MQTKGIKAAQDVWLKRTREQRRLSIDAVQQLLHGAAAASWSYLRLFGSLVMGSAARLPEVLVPLALPFTMVTPLRCNAVCSCVMSMMYSPLDSMASMDAMGSAVGYLAGSLTASEAWREAGLSAGRWSLCAARCPAGLGEGGWPCNQEAHDWLAGPLSHSGYIMPQVPQVQLRRAAGLAREHTALWAPNPAVTHADEQKMAAAHVVHTSTVSLLGWQ